MVKPLLGKSVRSDWFFLGRSNQNSEKEIWILSFLAILHETNRKSKKDWNSFEISKMEEDLTNIVWAMFNSMQIKHRIHQQVYIPNISW